ncbi:hypothetical protein OG417_06575 [Actinoallomurus sp. NBC_01490]|uniref:hypothetical protein n=1 Tax=Actinoallomurus sp. NBC_01490 TaxID=2903557 RepID=UPI002E30042E|nr:hypothetical protein [Actinoallomurus sp. NBC_01490]
MRFAVRRSAVPRGHHPSEGGLPALRDGHLTPAPAADRSWLRDDRGLPVAAPGGGMLTASGRGTFTGPGRRTLARLLLTPVAGQETYAPASGLPWAASAPAVRPRRVPAGLLEPASTARPVYGPCTAARPVAVEEAEPAITGAADPEAASYGPCSVAVVEPGGGSLVAEGRRMPARPGRRMAARFLVAPADDVECSGDQGAYASRVLVGRPVVRRAEPGVLHLGEVTAGLLARHVSRGRPAAARRPALGTPSAASGIPPSAVSEIPRRERRSLPGRRAGVLTPRVR